MEELYPDDYWLDEEDGEEELPDPAMKRKPVSGRLHDEPMVTGYEALERQRGVKVIEERTPAAENRRLILGACHGIVDVLILHRLCIEPAGELAHPVRVHHQIRDRLLGRQRSFPVSGLSGAALLIFCFLQSHPPFPQRPDG